MPRLRTSARPRCAKSWHTPRRAQRFGCGRRDGGRALLVLHAFVDPGGDAFDRVARGVRAGELPGDRLHLLVERGVARRRQVLAPGVLQRGGSQLGPRQRIGRLGAAQTGLHDRVAGDRELPVRAVEVERVDPRAPVVAVAGQRRAGAHVDAVLGDLLGRGVRRREPRLVVRRVDLAPVPEAGVVPDPEPPPRRGIPRSITLSAMLCPGSSGWSPTCGPPRSRSAGPRAARAGRPPASLTRRKLSSAWHRPRMRRASSSTPVRPARGSSSPSALRGGERVQHRAGKSRSRSRNSSAEDASTPCRYVRRYASYAEQQRRVVAHTVGPQVSV